MLWLSLNSLGKLWQSSRTGQTRVPAASSSALRFSTAACGERLTAGPGQGLSTLSFCHPQSPGSSLLLSLSPRKKNHHPPTSNFSISALKATPRPSFRGLNAHTPCAFGSYSSCLPAAWLPHRWQDISNLRGQSSFSCLSIGPYARTQIPGLSPSRCTSQTSKSKLRKTRSLPYT